MIVFICRECGNISISLPISGEFILAKGVITPGQDETPIKLGGSLTVEVMQNWMDHCFATCPMCDAVTPVHDVKTTVLSTLTLENVTDTLHCTIDQGVALEDVPIYVTIVMENALYDQYREFFGDIVTVMADVTVIN